MHELSIATALMDQILDEAGRGALKRVDRVELRSGVLRQVIPEVLQEAFREVRVGTIAEQAELVVQEVPAQAQCRICRKKFQPELNYFVCPSCNKADVDILQGDEILLMAISGI